MFKPITIAITVLAGGALLTGCQETGETTSSTSGPSAHSTSSTSASEPTATATSAAPSGGLIYRSEGALTFETPNDVTCRMEGDKVACMHYTLSSLSGLPAQPCDPSFPEPGEVNAIVIDSSAGWTCGTGVGVNTAPAAAWAAGLGLSKGKRGSPILKAGQSVKYGANTCTVEQTNDLTCSSSRYVGFKLGGSSVSFFSDPPKYGDHG